MPGIIASNIFMGPVPSYYHLYYSSIFFIISITVNIFYQLLPIKSHSIISCCFSMASDFNQMFYYFSLILLSHKNYSKCVMVSGTFSSEYLGYTHVAPKLDSYP